MNKLFKKTTAAMGILFIGTILTAKANAECGNLKLPRAGASFQPQSWQSQSEFRSASLLSVQSGGDPIVGMWQVTLIAKGNAEIPDGTVIDKGFSQWHSDGTEILNSSRPPVTQSFCLGVWRQTGVFRYKLNHFAISWDQNSNLVGPANIREQIILSRNERTFAGTFTLDQYDQAGNNLVHITGDVTGKRITVNTPATSVF